MFFSGTTEAEWLQALEDLPTWSVPSAPAASLLIVSPHPDDETLGCGGLIAAERWRGTQVRVVAVTDGEHAYPGAEGGEPLAVTRRKEQDCALARLGVGPDCVLRFGFTDSDVSTHEAELAERLTKLLTPETYLVAPWEGDFHPDHEVCGRASAEAARRTGAKLISYFFWSWHRGTPQTLAGLDLARFPLDDQWLQAKTEALACHRSQLERKTGGPVLPPELLGPARRAFEVFLVRS